jgi:hypothetical protein
VSGSPAADRPARAAFLNSSPHGVPGPVAGQPAAVRQGPRSDLRRKNAGAVDRGRPPFPGDGPTLIIALSTLRCMILPGLISLAFYKRRPSSAQIVLGLIATIALSAALGYISPGGPLGPWGSVLVAVIGGVLLYAGILAYLMYRYQPAHSLSARPANPPDPHP